MLAKSETSFKISTGPPSVWRVGPFDTSYFSVLFTAAACIDNEPENSADDPDCNQYENRSIHNRSSIRLLCAGFVLLS